MLAFARSIYSGGNMLTVFVPKSWVGGLGIIPFLIHSLTVLALTLNSLAASDTVGYLFPSLSLSMVC